MSYLIFFCQNSKESDETEILALLGFKSESHTAHQLAEIWCFRSYNS